VCVCDVTGLSTRQLRLVFVCVCVCDVTGLSTRQLRLVFVCVCVCDVCMCGYLCVLLYRESQSKLRRGRGLGSRPKKMYGERWGDGVEYHLMKPTPRR